MSPCSEYWFSTWAILLGYNGKRSTHEVCVKTVPMTVVFIGNSDALHLYCQQPRPATMFGSRARYTQCQHPAPVICGARAWVLVDDHWCVDQNVGSLVPFWLRVVCAIVNLGPYVLCLGSCRFYLTGIDLMLLSLLSGLQAGALLACSIHLGLLCCWLLLLPKPLVRHTTLTIGTHLGQYITTLALATYQPLVPISGVYIVTICQPSSALAPSLPNCPSDISCLIIPHAHFASSFFYHFILFYTLIPFVSIFFSSWTYLANRNHWAHRT